MVIDMLDDQITLRQLAAKKRADGVMDTTVTEKQIFCDVSNVSASEFFAAGQNGIHADYRFTIWGDEYSGEKEVKYLGKLYRVYRLYRPDVDHLELYVEERVGV